MRVAVLGTGIMGAPMARNLAAAGHEVSAWNRSREKAEPLAEHGITVAGSVAEAVAGAEVVVTMLADAPAVEAVAEEALGALDGAVLAQMSTIGLAATDRLAQRAADAGVAFVDAPVSGTRQPAEEGKLVVLASGPEEVRERVDPVFDAVGAKTVWLGEAGEAQRLKLVLNTWLLGLTEALAEAIALAEGLGVDPRRFLETIDGAPVGAPYAQVKGPMMIDGEFRPRSARPGGQGRRAGARGRRGGGPAARGARRGRRADAARERGRARRRGHGRDDPRQPAGLGARLIIVDYENDFARPDGALSVPAARRSRTPSTGMPVGRLRPRAGDARLASGRPWLLRGAGRAVAPHCVQETEGAALHPGLDDRPDRRDRRQGPGPGTEGYSGFEATGLAERLREDGVDEVTIVGLATDYCVKNTALDALREGFAVRVDPAAVRAWRSRPATPSGRSTS